MPTSAQSLGPAAVRPALVHEIKHDGYRRSGRMRRIAAGHRRRGSSRRTRRARRCAGNARSGGANGLRHQRVRAVGSRRRYLGPIFHRALFGENSEAGSSRMSRCLHDGRGPTSRQKAPNDFQRWHVGLRNTANHALNSGERRPRRRSWVRLLVVIGSSPTETSYGPRRYRRGFPIPVWF